jgi:hypothetical protein
MTHPRPHLVRAHWQSLDGIWSFAFDPGQEGEHQGWHLPGHTWPLHIEVPFPWESSRSGVGPPAPDRYVRGNTGWLASTGWYARRVDVPAEWAGESIWLVVGAAYWESTAWVNGHCVGDHAGGFDPFEFDISDAVGPDGIADLVLRVRAPEDTDEYPHGKNTRYWYSRASGIWQSVFIEPRPVMHVAGLRVRADPATGDVDARVSIRAAHAGSPTVKVHVELDGRPVASAETTVAIPSGMSTQSVRATVPTPRLWDCRSPTLYDVHVALGAVDGRTDLVETTTGFRSISFEPLPEGGPSWLHLNGEPLYLRAVMSQGYHPDGIWAYPDEAIIEQDLAAAKRMGFDMVRLHVKVEDPRVLAWADRLGVLLWCEVPDFLTPSPQALERWEQTFRAMLERDAGHPSVALWCLFIESWGLGLNQFGFGGAERRFVDDVDMQLWVERMYALGRSLDPERPIIENSVCEADHTVAEVNDIHLFPPGYGGLDERAAEELLPWIAGAIPGSAHNFAPGYVQDRQPLMVSSMAGWASVDGVETSFPFRSLVNAIRREERIAGYGWVQLYDVEWERTGMLTYERQAKAFGYDVSHINTDDLLVVDGAPARLAALGEPIPIEVGLAHASGMIHGEVRLRAALEGLVGAWRPLRMDVAVDSPRATVHRRGVITMGRIMVHDPGAAFAGSLRLEALDEADRVVARTLLNVAWIASEKATMPSIWSPLPLDRWASVGSPDAEAIEVAGSRQRLAGVRIACRFSVPDGGTPGRVVRLLAEAAVGVGDMLGQTVGPTAMLPVEVRLDGALVAEADLPPLRADSRGSLSIVHPEGLGSYGGRLDVRLGLSSALSGREHEVEVRPRPDERDHRIVLFGPLLGSVPLGPTLAIDDDRQ